MILQVNHNFIRLEMIFIVILVFNALMFITSGRFRFIHCKYYKLLSNIFANLTNAPEDNFWEEKEYEFIKKSKQND